MPLKQLSPKLWQTTWQGITYLHVYCPACKSPEQYRIRDASGVHPSWEWNGSIEKPSFNPSMRITAPPSNYCCHYYVTDGQFQYCDDCSHDMKGQVVDMPDFPEFYQPDNYNWPDDS